MTSAPAVEGAELQKLGFRLEGPIWLAPAWTKKQYDFLLYRCRVLGCHGRGVRLTEKEIAAMGLRWRDRRRRDAEAIIEARDQRWEAKCQKFSAEMERQNRALAARKSYQRAIHAVKAARLG